MSIDWGCAIKAFGGVALYAVFIAAIMTGGFIGSTIASISLFFTAAFGALGLCLYKICAGAKEQKARDAERDRCGRPSSAA